MFENTIYEFRKELENLGYCKNVVDNYPKYITVFLEHTKQIPPEVSTSDIKIYQEYLKEKPHKTKDKKLSQSHVHSQMLAIRIYFEYLERIQKINKNPFTLKLKSPISEVKIILTQEEIATLYLRCNTAQEWAIMHLCYGCGLRRSESQNLDVADVHLDKKLLFVRKGKGKKRRVIPITATIAKDFETYLKIRESPSFGGVREAAFLLDDRGNRMQGNTIYKTFKDLLKRTKIQYNQAISLHHLRHSIATHLLENEMSIEMVRNFLGHQNLNTTQIYTRINQLKMK
jgi:integrase/recombinase XerD